METPWLRTGRAPVSPSQMARRGASGSLRTHADDEQAGAVGQFRTTEEVLEQSRQPVAEGMEGRELAKRNSLQSTALRAQGRARVVRGLERIRQVAKRDKEVRFTALLHHVYDVDMLREAYFNLKRDAAAGVDGETWQHYGEDLEANLQDLSRRLKEGTYQATPVRRTYIPKADGRQRPLGVTSQEDKVVQRAVVAVLNAIYETEFLGFSYGFRAGRSQHNALDALDRALIDEKSGMGA